MIFEGPRAPQKLTVYHTDQTCHTTWAPPLPLTPRLHLTTLSACGMLATPPSPISRVQYAPAQRARAIRPRRVEIGSRSNPVADGISWPPPRGSGIRESGSGRIVTSPPPPPPLRLAQAPQTNLRGHPSDAAVRVGLVRRPRPEVGRGPGRCRVLARRDDRVRLAPGVEGPPLTEVRG